ncbi:MAG: L-threonylcarbamoyladenylate synthase [bacterium]|jgi:L-threonylcarbamoyladenylate synthase
MVKIYDFDSISDADYKDIKYHLRTEGIIIYPTETSYALGANALDNSAVRKIYELKGRTADKPLPVLVKDLNMLLNIATVNRREEDVISKFWPGPLTIIFNLKSKKSAENYLFAAGSESVGARISPHPFAVRLFEEIDFPLISTSANDSGKESFSDFNELNEKLLSRPLDVNIFAVNAGELAGGSSTIVKIGKKDIEIIREGDNNIKKRLICSIKNKE